MKKTGLTMFIILSAALFSFGQDARSDDEIRTLFSKYRSNGIYGAFSVDYSEIDSRDALLFGFRTLLVFDHSFGIGAGGKVFFNDLDYHHYYRTAGNPDFYYAGGYGGLYLEPVLAGRAPVHVSFPILLGAGGVSMFNSYYPEYWETGLMQDEYDYDFYFVFEPGMELEFNLSKFFRTSASVSYRLTSRIDMYHPETGRKIDEKLLEGLNFGLAFKFGKF